MRVLIIGCGYVGTALGEALVREGYEVWGLRRNPAPMLCQPAGIQPLAADLRDPASLARLPCAYDFIVNCISASGGGAEEYRRVYVRGMVNLVSWIGLTPIRKLVYTSSTGVYGQDDGSEVNERSPTEPETETGRILVEAEEVLRRAFHANRLPAVILRVAGIYGPGRGYWLRQFMSGEARIAGGGERVLNMVHRDDVAGAIMAALQRGEPGQAYNVADNEPVTQKLLFQWLADRLKRDLPPASGAPEAALRRGGSKRVSNRRLRSELGYEPRYPTFREGFEAEIKGFDT